jgi:hypothetical protein
VRGRSARVVLDELIERLRLGVGVLEHPEEVLEQHDLAADDGTAHAAASGAVDEVLEQRVADEFGGDEVAAARFTDVHRVEARRHAVGAVERHGASAAISASCDDGRRWDDDASPPRVLAVVAGARREPPRRARDPARRVPPLDHALELAHSALRHCLARSTSREGEDSSGKALW